MSRFVALLLVLVASVARGQVNHLNLIMTAEPSVDPDAAAQGFYLPGETVHFTVSLAMTHAPAPDVEIVLVNYLASTALIDIGSDAIVPGFPLTIVVDQFPFFGATTSDVPSPLTIPLAPSAIDFFTFNAFAPASLGQTEIVSILGTPEFGCFCWAYAHTSGGAINWENFDEDPDHQILGGELALTSVPEPSAVVIVAMVMSVLCLRRKPGRSHCVLAFLTAAAALSMPVAARAQVIVDSNPPQNNPWCNACPVFRDVLQPGATTELTQGIGGTATPALGGVHYSVISVTFDTSPSPSPAFDNVTVSCETIGADTSLADCPSIVDVQAQGATYALSLSGPIPPTARMTISFAGTAATLVYEYVPGDVDFSATTDSADLIALQEALADGSAELTENLPRYDMNRSGSVDAADFVRVHELIAAYTAAASPGPPSSEAVIDSAVGLPPPRGVPAAWQADDLHWCRDQEPRNKIDDLIDASSASVFDVVVNLKTGVTGADTALLQALSTSDAPVRKLKFLPSVSVQAVSRSGLETISVMENVAFIEGQWGFTSDLEITIPTVCLTAPPPETGAGCPVTVAAQYPWLDGSGVNIVIMDSGVDDGPAGDPPGSGTHDSLPLAAFYYGAVPPASFTNPNPGTGSAEAHGTHVASIALGRLLTYDDGTDRRGVATGAGLIDVRYNFASGCVGDWLQAIDALETVLSHRTVWSVRVINMSFHQQQQVGNNCEDVPSDGMDSFSQMVDLASTMGILVVC